MESSFDKVEGLANIIKEKASPNELKVIIDALKGDKQYIFDMIINVLDRLPNVSDRLFYYRIVLGEEIPLDEIKRRYLEYDNDSNYLSLELALMASIGRKDVPISWFTKYIREFESYMPHLWLEPKKHFSSLLAKCCMGRDDVTVANLEKLLNHAEDEVIKVCAERKNIPIGTIEKWFSTYRTPYPGIRTNDYKLAALASCLKRKPTERTVNILLGGLKDAENEVRQYAEQVIFSLQKSYPSDITNYLVDEVNFIHDPYSFSTESVFYLMKRGK